MLNKEEFEDMEQRVNNMYAKVEKMYDMFADIRALFVEQESPPVVELDRDAAVKQMLEGDVKYPIIDVKGNNLGLATAEYINALPFAGYSADNAYYLCEEIDDEMMCQIILDLKV